MRKIVRCLSNGGARNTIWVYVRSRLPRNFHLTSAHTHTHTRTHAHTHTQTHTSTPRVIGHRAREDYTFCNKTRLPDLSETGASSVRRRAHLSRADNNHLAAAIFAKSLIGSSETNGDRDANNPLLNAVHYCDNCVDSCPIRYNQQLKYG
jgi:hypothetical protein